MATVASVAAMSVRHRKRFNIVGRNTEGEHVIYVLHRVKYQETTPLLTAPSKNAGISDGRDGPRS